MPVSKLPSRWDPVSIQSSNTTKCLLWKHFSTDSAFRSQLSCFLAVSPAASVLLKYRKIIVSGSQDCCEDNILKHLIRCLLHSKYSINVHLLLLLFWDRDPPKAYKSTYPFIPLCLPSKIQSLSSWSQAHEYCSFKWVERRIERSECSQNCRRKKSWGHHQITGFGGKNTERFGLCFG